jgi:hypothetical protein
MAKIRIWPVPQIEAGGFAAKSIKHAQFVFTASADSGGAVHRCQWGLFR